MALLKTGQDHDAPLRIVEAVVAVNDARKRAMARKVAAALGGELRGKTIAVLGLTFKPNTDDMREAPSIPLVTALQDMGAKVRAYDPTGMEQAKPLIVERRVLQGRLRLRRGRLRAGDRDRMGAVPRARFRAAEDDHAAPGAGRPAQHLPARRKSRATALPMKASGGRSHDSRRRSTETLIGPAPVRGAGREFSNFCPNCFIRFG